MARPKAYKRREFRIDMIWVEMDKKKIWMPLCDFMYFDNHLDKSAARHVGGVVYVCQQPIKNVFADHPGCNLYHLGQSSLINYNHIKEESEFRIESVEMNDKIRMDVSPANQIYYKIINDANDYNCWKKLLMEHPDNNAMRFHRP